jgi:3-dehydroquinate dehydratase/shikimate dehydrogenase
MKMICVSVCAKTATELIENIKRAEESADVIEARFDCLDAEEMQKGLTNLPGTDKILLGTFRPREQGGMREISKEERQIFWQKTGSINWADIEPDLVKELSTNNISKVICSHHDFQEVPQNLEKIYESLKETGADIIKIAVHTNDVSEGLPIWKLLKKAKRESKKFIPVAMGEAGKWTRILGLAYGAPMTYAALETGKEVAPGQISAEELRDVYRIKELNEETEIYGVIGAPIGHSLSPRMQNAAFKAEGLNAVLVPFEIKDLDSFITRFLPESELNIKGFAVTIPHKQAVIKYLHEIDETAQKIGAVNTVKIVDGKLYGYNTDAAGFITPLKNNYGKLNGAKTSILGAGGAARACVYALRNAGAEVTVFARDIKKATPLASEFGVELMQLPVTGYGLPFTGFDIVVNATPLGMKGEFSGQSPAAFSQLKNVSVVYDLVYNPSVTNFIKEAEKAAVPTVIGGLDMLVEQGREQFKIWTGKDASKEKMSLAVSEKIGQ